MTNQLINLVIGDWSNDGHGRTTTVLIEANRSDIEIQKAYAKAVTSNKIPPFCDDYQDSSISEDLWDKLTELGVIPPDWAGDPGEDGEFTGYLDTDGYAEIYINIAKLGDPGLEVKVLNVPDIHAGGYGLFY